MRCPPEKLIVYQMMVRLFGNKKSGNKLYGTIPENGVGKFNDISAAAIEGIKELGVTHVWYTGILEHALLTDYTAYGIPLDDADVVKGRAGSPYAIKDYYDVDPDLAENVPQRMAEFEDLVARTHAHDLKVIIDFVPNHVARGYHSDAAPPGTRHLGEGDDRTVGFHRDNNFYYLPGTSFQPPHGYVPLGSLPHPTKDGKFAEIPARATGNDEFSPSPPIDSWFDTVKLNYGVDIHNHRSTHFYPIPDTWIKMRDILLFWASKKVDGFRCDMAEMIPVEFWQWVIEQLKDLYPALIFIAEVYDPSQYERYVHMGKFDYLYGKVLLYDLLRLLIVGKGSTANIEKMIKRVEPIQDHMLRFLENHDEQRIASRFFAGAPRPAFPAMVISATIGRGPVMIYFGQEVGEPALGSAGFQADDGRTTIFDYWGVPEHQKWMNGGKFDGGKLSAEQKQLRGFYTDLLRFVSGNRAIASGGIVDITAHNIEAGNCSHQVHAFLRFYEDERLLIVNSFNKTDQTAKIHIPKAAFTRMGLATDKKYIAREVIWKELETGFDADIALPLVLKPYSCFIFRIN